MAIGTVYTNGLVVNTGTNGITSSTLVLGGDPVGTLATVGGLTVLGATTFTEAANIGRGSINLLGLNNPLTNVPGTFYLGADGRTYFVEDAGGGLLGTQLTVLPEVTSYTGGFAYQYGTAGANTLTGTGTSDALFGAAYNAGAADTGADTLSGGGGNDVLFGFAGNDSLNAGSGLDTVYGGAGNDSIDGGAGNDYLDGGADNDTILGGDGADTILGGAGTDSIFGGIGADSISGGAGNDTIFGDDGADTIDGGDGDDSLYGGFGSDTIIGGAGNDTIGGGAAPDSLVGGDGFDIVDYSDTNQSVVIDLSNQTVSTPVVGGAAAGDTISGFEGAIGSGVDDTITGSAGDNQLYGAGGADIIYGGAGNDYIDGGLGADTLFGGVGIDLIYGGNGVDQITFGRGDSVYGGNNNDTFIIDDTLDNPNGQADTPIFIDGGANDAGAGDTIDLTSITGWSNVVTDAATGSGTITLSDGTVIGYTGIEAVLCFTPGTMIRTLGGQRAIETLKVGDMVLTRDSGLQPVRWIGTSKVAGTDAFAPIRIRQGAVPDLTADLLVSPQHRMLIEGYRAQLMFGEREVLASAKHMVDGKFVTVEEMAEVTYVHMLFDRHEVVYANGSATESYHPASYGLGGMCEEAREELFAIFPELRSMPDSYGDTARRVLKGYEVSALAW